jgi:hypothetical protein
MRAIVIILALVVGGSGMVQAQPGPSDVNFGQLVLGGSIGALVGGVGGGLAAYGICRATTAAGPWADLACLAGAMLFGYLPGVPIGATVGVSMAGSLQKAKGNVWLALVGASLGGAVAFFTSDWALRALSQTPQAQEIVDVLRPIVLLGVVPVAAGWGAAWGYSVGARTD